MKVLMCAYACWPGLGSEPGVGWAWARAVAREHEVWVLTHSANATAIEAALAEDDSLARLRPGVLAQQRVGAITEPSSSRAFLVLRRLATSPTPAGNRQTVHNHRFRYLPSRYVRRRLGSDRSQRVGWRLVCLGPSGRLLHQAESPPMGTARCRTIVPETSVTCHWRAIRSSRPRRGPSPYWSGRHVNYSGHRSAAGVSHTALRPTNRLANTASGGVPGSIRRKGSPFSASNAMCGSTTTGAGAKALTTSVFCPWITAARCTSHCPTIDWKTATTKAWSAKRLPALSATAQWAAGSGGVREATR